MPVKARVVNNQFCNSFLVNKQSPEWSQGKVEGGYGFARNATKIEGCQKLKACTLPGTSNVK